MQFTPSKEQGLQKPLSPPTIQSSQKITSNLPDIYISMDSLPSKGLSYPVEGEVSYRPYTFGEIKKITQSKFINDKQKLEMSLKGVICNFGVENLTLPDALYLIMLRNISSVKGSGFVFNIECDVCGNKIRKEVKLDQVEFDDLNLPALPIVAELGNQVLHFSPITVADYFYLIDKKLQDDDTAILAKQCKNLEFEVANDFIYNLSNADDLQTLNEIDKLLYHGVKTIEIKCNNSVDGLTCGHITEVELQGGQALVLPFRESTKSPRSRIRYGL